MDTPITLKNVYTLLVGFSQLSHSQKHEVGKILQGKVNPGDYLSPKTLAYMSLVTEELGKGDPSLDLQIRENIPDTFITE